jgi:hypothetical protein
MPSQRFVRVEPNVLAKNFNRCAFAFKHDLVSHPLLQVGALYELARRIPQDETLHWRGDISVAANIDTASQTHATGVSLKDTFDRIENAGSYVLIRNAQLDPAFARLTNEILDEVATLTEPFDPGMCQRIAYVFIASPGSVTPYHMDRDINFHFNVRGTKRISIWDPFDREVLPETGLESLFSDWKAPRPPYKAEYECRAKSFELGPGDGVHHPFTAPHAVRYGSEVAISFTVTFNTRSTMRRAGVHLVNRALRRAGLEPTPCGGSRARDELKFGALTLFRRAKSLLRVAQRGQPVPATRATSVVADV